MKVNLVEIKALDFAIRIVKLQDYLTDLTAKDHKKEFVMSKQILRSGTSIGANISEATAAESIDDFIHKLAISQKEAHETRFWLKLLYMTEYINEKMYLSMLNDCEQLIKMLVKIIKTSKQNDQKQS